MLYIDLIERETEMRNIRIINADTVFGPENESHYAIHTQFDSLQYPQVHDFHEIILVVSGKMDVEIGRRLLTLKEGALLWIRPGDIHSKIANGPCVHINLAFPRKLVGTLFGFIDKAAALNQMQEMQELPVVQLTPNRKNTILHKLERLHLVPFGNEKSVKAELRVLLVEIITYYFIPSVCDEIGRQYAALPPWFSKLLSELNKEGNFSEGVGFIFFHTDKSREYVCRVFRKYLGTTATEYINNIRLNYAANLLTHTDKEIIDISLEVGFQSLSYFYRLFRQEFSLTPLQFRTRFCKNMS